MSVERTALFVRVPTGLADQLAARTRSAGRSKQDVVCSLLEAQLSEGSRGPDTQDGPEVVDPEILDLDAVALMLAIEPAMVLARVADGDFPGRRFGTDWRFSRQAVMLWLAGTDSVTSVPRTGFATD